MQSPPEGRVLPGPGYGSRTVDANRSVRSVLDTRRGGRYKGRVVSPAGQENMVTTERAISVRRIGADRRDEWDAFVASVPNGHLLQSWAWGDFKRRYGWLPVRLAAYCDGEIRVAAQVLFRSVAGFSLAYIPRGPVASVDDSLAYGHLLDAVHRVSRKRRSIFLKVEPNEPSSSPIGGFLRSRGFVRSPHTVQARASLVADLEGGPDAVLKRLKKQTRYNIRLAERRGISVRHQRDDADLVRFHELVGMTGERNDFPTRSIGYFRDVLEEFRRRDAGELLVAEKDGKVIGGMLRLAFGQETLCMHGASDPEYWRDKPNYLLQWRAMEWAMEKGCTRYDLWGIPEEAIEGVGGGEAVKEREEGGSWLWGVYAFKLNFGDRPIRYAGAYDHPYIRPLYLLWAHLRKDEET